MTFTGRSIARAARALPLAIAFVAAAAGAASAQTFEPPPPRPGPGGPPPPKVDPVCPSGASKLLIVDKNDTQSPRYKTIAQALECVKAKKINDAVVEVYATPTDRFPEHLIINRPDVRFVGRGGPTRDGPVRITPDPGQPCVTVDIPSDYPYQSVTTAFHNFIFDASVNTPGGACIHVQRGKLTLNDSRIEVSNAQGTAVRVDATSWFEFNGAYLSDHGIFFMVEEASDRDVTGIEAVRGSASVVLRNIRLAGLDTAVRSNALINEFVNANFRANIRGVEITDNAIALEYAPSLTVRGGKFEFNSDAIILYDMFASPRETSEYANVRRLFRNRVRIGGDTAPVRFDRNHRGVTIEAKGVIPQQDVGVLFDNVEFAHHNADALLPINVRLQPGGNSPRTNLKARTGGCRRHENGAYRAYAVCLYGGRDTKTEFNDVIFRDNALGVDVRGDLDGLIELGGRTQFFSVFREREPDVGLRAVGGYFGRVKASLTIADGPYPSLYLGGGLSSPAYHYVNIEDPGVYYGIVLFDRETSSYCNVSLRKREDQDAFEAGLRNLDIYYGGVHISDISPDGKRDRSRRKRLEKMQDLLCNPNPPSWLFDAPQRRARR